MNLFKKLAAAVLAAVMVLSLVGCHKENEIAVTVGDYEFTSAYYMCALVYADTDARGAVDKKLEEEKEESEDETEATTEEVDYYAQKIEGKKFEDHVKAEALVTLKRVAAYKTKCKEEKLELEQTVLDNTAQYADYYWTQYGYQQMLEPNGVAKSTFLDYMRDTYYASLYFEHLYGEDGEREIDAEKVTEKMNAEFALVNMLTANYAEGATDEDKAALKTKIDAYANDLSNGKTTFEEVYNEYNNVEETEETEEAEETEEEEVEEGSEPLDDKSQVIGSDETSYVSDYFETVKGMEVGAVTVENTDSGLVLIVKKDLNADPYYVDELDMQSRQLLEGETLEEEMEKLGETLSFKENKYATKQFKVKNIKYPETTS